MMDNVIDFDTTVLTDRDVRILNFLAKAPKGRPVRNTVVERFGEYEGAGLVKLSAALFGPLGVPDLENFWARITPFGLLVLEKVRFGWVP